MKVHLVTWVRPETGRSNPGYGEAEFFVEARRDTACMRSSNFGLGVKSQSRPVIAGSYRNGPQSSLKRDSQKGRATDLKIRRRNPSTSCPTPNILAL